ncbi:MAG: hypothetical protein ACXWXP_03390 [Actinomycetota bacterium]
MVVNVGSSSRSADERGAVVRKLVTLLVAVVVLGIAAPASAVDDEFRGRYRARWRPVEGLCSPVRHMVSIRYVGELRRLYDPAGRLPTWPLRYEGGRHPWMWNGGLEGALWLNYRPHSDTAVGFAGDEDCTWHITLT